jgi:hypothetical protein
MSDDTIATLLTDEKGVRLVMGYDGKRNTTQIECPLTATVITEMPPVLFRTGLLRSLFVANRDAKKVTWSIMSQKSTHMAFEVDGMTIEYVVGSRNGD